MSNITYVQGDYYLKDITTLSQYIMNLNFAEANFKLITIIGEYHNIVFNCKEDKPTLSIDKYMFKNDLETKIILETDDTALKHTSSLNINRVLDAIKPDIKGEEEIEVEIKNKNIKILLIDYRYKFLTKIAYYSLYVEDINKTSRLNYKDFYEMFIEPFYKKINDYLDIEDPEKYSPMLFEVRDFYVKQLYNSFNQTSKQIEEWDTMTNFNVKYTNVFGIEVGKPIKQAIIEDIRSLWARVSDYFVIKEFFQLDDTREYIILIGEYHYKNIKSFLDLYLCNKDNFAKIIDKNTYIMSSILSKAPINCVNTKGTARIINKDENTDYLTQVNMKSLKKK
jgi:hypothetical protein